MTVQLKKGFTLIELLIVIAILGTLAVVVLLALNPVQQLARTRDSGRIAGVTQLGHAIEAYAVSHNGLYPTENATWITTLVNAGEIQTTPSGITDSVGPGGCTNVAVNSTWCYDYNAAAAQAIVYASLESVSSDSLCATPATQRPWAVYSTADGRGGVVCTGGTEPTSGNQTFRN